MIRVLIFVAFFTFSNNSFAYVNCQNVDVKVQSTSSSSFHNFSEKGLTGSLVFLEIPPVNCSNSTNEGMATRVFLVIDDVDTANEFVKTWLSILLSAEARGVKIIFHANDLGMNSHGFQIITPYYLSTQ